LIYYFSPIFGFFISLLVWLLVPYLSGFIYFELGMLFFLACNRLGVYTAMIQITFTALREKDFEAIRIVY
jgi:NADH:ubiquinone oxidoreductase subunit H